MVQRTWSLPQPSGQSEQLVEALGLSPVVAEILVQRGITRVEEALEFLRPTLFNLASPFCFRDMGKALERLKQAQTNGEKILIYGDYDVDGVTSVALLYKVLIDLGFKAVSYIPHRLEEGYGLHREAIARAGQASVRVIITVDCGITACEEIEIARQLGIDVIISDHHEPPETLPNALAILNPKVDDNYPFRELAGVGVAFKLAQALFQRFKNKDIGPYAEREVLDLVALGTISDVVPLVGENRILVREGLKQMEETVHIGLAVLLKECGLEDKTLKAGQIAFIIAPRINAAGRMDSARAGLELLLTGDPERAQDLARRLSKENQTRQETEKRILAQAIAELEKGPLPLVIVLSSPEWHHGVIGIVASRLVERYYRPVFLISEDGDEGKGSARGIHGYHVLEELTSQTNLLHKFGGHRQAAGFSLAKADIPRLRSGLNRSAERFPEALFQETLFIDNKVSLGDITEELVTDIERLAPFGAGNPGPTLAVFNLPVVGVNYVGRDNNHLKFRLGARGEWEGMAFRQGERLKELMGQESIDAAFSLEINTFKGQRKLQLVLQDIRVKASWEARTRRTAAMGQVSNMSLETMGQVAATFAEFQPNMDACQDIGYWERDELARIYRELQALAKTSNPFIWGTSKKESQGLENAVRIFEELGFLRCLGGTNPWQIELLPIQGKLDLELSLRYRSTRKRWEKCMKKE
ncbi:MAG: single-stranded-DNA-specific exonuclease RecJ [Desulfitobacteriaceae bacterium]